MNKTEIKAKLQSAYDSAVEKLDTYKGSVAFAGGLVVGFVLGLWIGG